MEHSLSETSPVAIARPRGAPRFEAFSPKLGRRVCFYRRAVLEQWLLIEADAAAVAFCERPGYVQTKERKYLVDFWVRYADRQELIFVIETDDEERDKHWRDELGESSIPIRCVPRIELIALRAWIDNWQRMLPCIIATRGLIAPTMHAAIERFVKQPQTLITIEREFSNGDLIVARAAVFGLLHQGRVSASELHTQPLSLLTHFNAVGAR
jgi:hypothetical protein